MLMRSTTVRSKAETGLCMAILGTLPLVIAIAVGQETKPEAGPAILRGRVGGEIDQPLAGVRVRVAIPATDMRFVHPGSGQIQFETISDDNGEYRLEIAGVVRPTVVSVDAMKPGHRRLSGMLMRIAAPPPRPQVSAGAITDANLKLEEALYFKGVVVDEKGEPIPAVEIGAYASTGRATGGVERTVSDQNGEFELFNYSTKPEMINNEATKGLVYFSHSDYVSQEIGDLYAVAENERAVVRIVMATGHKLSGSVHDTSGKPVPNVMVKAINRKGGHNRKAAMTDKDGRFSLLGLSAGATVLSARDLGLRQKIQMPVDLDRDLSDLDVRLEAMILPANLKTYTVLGMQLTDTTPEVKAAYDLFDRSGALILDPGEKSERLNIGQLEHGYNFWMVGNNRVGSVREFVEQILTEVGDADREQYSIRCVYSFSRLDFDGTNTQYLKLTKNDIDQLKGVLEKIPAAAK